MPRNRPETTLTVNWSPVFERNGRLNDHWSIKREREGGKEGVREGERERGGEGERERVGEGERKRERE